jgi:Ni/Fe-hydrogenase subunit HybB-like protein
MQLDADNTSDDPRQRPTLITGEPGRSLPRVTEEICRIAESPRAPLAWYSAFAVALLALAVLGAMIAYLIFTGVGVWNLNTPVGWAFDITNFVFWIGIGHAGTLISAILFLFRQKWRTSINRFAEAMTIFAVICAGMFPAIHLGRAWFIYWLFPYPNQMAFWPNFLSPLLWDMFAVSTYFTVSLMFWYLGMVPDLATFRDRAQDKWRYYIYGILSLGWRGSQRHWHVYETAYLLLAALATPLVLSVHSVVSFDFAVSQMPGWHSTIFPPYFVVGAIFSGFAMVLTLAIPAREMFGLKDFITPRHLDNMAKFILAMGSLVGFAYVTEYFTALYGGNHWEQFQLLDRNLGPLWWCGWVMLICNAVVPQLFWLKFARRNVWVIFAVCILVNVGMWMERFVIIVGGLHRDFLPSSWGSYSPSYVEVLTLIGSFGLFLTLFLLFCRYLPVVAMAEVKSILPKTKGEKGTVPDQLSVGASRNDPRPTCGLCPAEHKWGLSPFSPGDENTEETGRNACPPGGNTTKPWALLAEYPDAASLSRAAIVVRDAGYRKWDCHSPFPVHDLDEAMGIRRTILPWFVLCGGMAGCAAAIAMQWYVNSPHTVNAKAGVLSGFPLVFSGKPFWSLPAHIPVAFELTVLFAALAAFFGLWGLIRLPRLYFPAFASRRFRKVTNDGFFISIEATDKNFDREATADMLLSTACSAIEEIEKDIS